MKNKIFLLLIIVISISSCKKKMEFSIDLFGNTEEILIGQEIQLTGEFLLDPYFIEVIDSFLIAIDTDNSTILNIINLNNGEQLFRTLKRGKGPYELIFTTNLHKYSPKNRHFYIGNEKILLYNLDSLIVNYENYEPNIIFNKKSNEFSGLDVLYINDSLYLSSTNFQFQKKYCLLDKEGSLITASLDYPEDDFSEDFTFKSLAYQGRFVKHPILNKFAFCMVNTPYFEIGNIENDTIKIIKDYYFNRINYKPIELSNNFQSVVMDKSNAYGFLRIVSTNEFIYLLYSGRNEEDFGDNIFQSPVILVFDWEGQPIKRYHLDNEINCFTVDETNSILYGISNKPKPMVFKYKI
ncbi:MAG: BF3164 family lipoprotein [Bacteroidales bacterium]